MRSDDPFGQAVVSRDRELPSLVYAVPPSRPAVGLVPLHGSASTDERITSCTDSMYYFAAPSSSGAAAPSCDPPGRLRRACIYTR